MAPKKQFPRPSAKSLSRWLCQLVLTLGIVGGQTGTTSASVVDIGSRRELFLDRALINDISGQAELRLHRPVPETDTFTLDAPWEGSGSVYVNVFKDGDIYRMFYKGVQIDPFKEADEKLDKSYIMNVPLCYAESTDGILWRRPVLGLHEFRGSQDNNIVILSGIYNGLSVDAGSASVFKDENPDAPAEARYKAILYSRSPKKGLLVFKSADGIHWSLLHNEVVITDGAFDSQNLAFWDPVHKVYRAYWRYFTRGTAASPYIGVRAIRTATSKDMVHWEGQRDLAYDDPLVEHLYTNQIKPYARAPHILIGFPTRYIEPELKGGTLDDARAPAGPEQTQHWSPSMRALPDLQDREARASASERYGSALTETVIMSSRDGFTFHRWNEAFLRPGIERVGSWNYGHLYMAWHAIETKSKITGAPNELSFYATEDYWTGNSSVLRRYTLRLDGFVSASAPFAGGEIVTQPIRFDGKRLTLNFSTSAAGTVYVEIQDENGQPIPGFTLADCDPIFGDTLDRAVTWRGGTYVGALANRPVRLRFVLKDADLFAYQFQP